MAPIHDGTLHALVHQHDKDLYRGNGKPGLTTRMQQTEDCLDVYEGRMDAQDIKLDKIDTKFWAIVVILIGLLVSVLTDIGLKVAGHGNAGIVSAPPTTASYTSSDSR